MGEDKKKVLALYDFASKQQFIYRTSKIKEISGASELLEGMYRRFAKWLKDAEKDFVYHLEKPFNINSFDAAGEVLYDGGGNLMVLYKDMDAYQDCNRIISAHIIEEYPTLSLIVSHVECSANFSEDKKKLYAQNRLRKNRCPAVQVSAVTPFTQIDPATFLPVSVKKTENGEDLSLSADREMKRREFEKNKKAAKEALQKITDPSQKQEAKKQFNLRYGFEEFTGLCAVIYIDGNDMGSKLVAVDSEDYNEGVAALRKFSEEVNRDFVQQPFAAFDAFFASHEQYKGYRKIIGGGDEITILCEAEAAYELMMTYFARLEQSNAQKQENKNFACAGIAVSHAKSPFTVAYDMAEAACESAKKRAHQTPGNYFDCYYCHAGVTADFETLRAREQAVTGRPYSIDEVKVNFGSMAKILQKAGRANVKALGEKAQMGEIAYAFEVNRVNAYLKENALLDPSGLTGTEKNEALHQMKLVYDMAEFYDLWFSKTVREEEEEHE